ncbi:pyrophosphorylase [Sphaerisporangium melleum]|uniref:2-C-methyl-D-erythritol 4-phosphate cytidylyltransferase n=1 Tax=Sphaerisporangium melleum TaxID=321316 RepID=A0A917QRD3_9ACTN|nr:bifunctional cytidylyltransferase/SDR family oxidoreductase [Sphaerisporangium melleum]GGK65334.1 pyrophosphorylase [Sphaerisporangium melleum]GII69969.1 pyrophosphorylase [Sphaerisporangium melleum]
MAAQEPRLRTVGVVLAGGVGQRVGLGTPKQLIEIAGRTILEHTLSVFESAPEIDEIVVLMAPGHVAEAERVVRRGGFRKVTKVVAGGASRPESTWRALQALGQGDCDVLLHDAVRPLVEPRIISECVEALRTHRAVGVAIPSSDTMVVAVPGPDRETIGAAPDRSLLRRSQTPQCFRLSVIREAYERAFADPEFEKRPATDDCGVVLRYLPEVPICIVPGSEHNLKVTHPVDLHIAERLFQLAADAVAEPQDPAAYREALTGSTVVVFGGEHGAGVAELAAGYGAAVHAFAGGPGGVRVTDPLAVAEALDRAAKESGRIDHVVYAAEVSYLGGLSEADDAAVAETVAAGHLGAVTVARAALRHLRESGGHLLLTISPAGYARPGAARPHVPSGDLSGSRSGGQAGPASGDPSGSRSGGQAGPASGSGDQAGSSLYASARAAVAALARALADEWAEYGVRVDCVTAGDTTPVRPPLSGRSPADAPPRTLAQAAIGLLASPGTGRVIETH